MREMGQLADVSIEPIEQTELIDNCFKTPGVLIAGVPGAGGFDAIFCICIGYSSNDRLLQFWESLGGSVMPLLASTSDTGLRCEFCD